MEEFYCVVTFNITQHALIFERFMSEKGINVKLMPVPRQVSSSCGTAAKIPCELELDIRRWCDEEDVSIDDFYKIVDSKGKGWFLKHINK